MAEIKEAPHCLQGFYQVFFGGPSRTRTVDTLINSEQPELTGYEDSIATDLHWHKRETRTDRSILTGCYVIETSREDLTAERTKAHLILSVVASTS